MRGRRRLRRNLQFDYFEYFYKPAGTPMRQLSIVEIKDEELEALRLQFLSGLKQEDAARRMGISQSQFQRDVVNAIEKITRALIEGDAIRIQVGNRSMGKQTS